MSPAISKRLLGCSELHCYSHETTTSLPIPHDLQCDLASERGLTANHRNFCERPPSGLKKALHGGPHSMPHESQKAANKDIGDKSEGCFGKCVENNASEPYIGSKSPSRSKNFCPQSSTTSVLTSSPSIDDRFKTACCDNHSDPSSTIGTNMARAELLPTSTIDGGTLESDVTLTPSHDLLDVEKGRLESQRMILQVQGMTCTGCEKKLFKTLSSLPEVSAVKTSLLLAQAEFNLQPSRSVNDENIASTLQKMTGFTCTKVVHIGEELELVVDGNSQTYADRSWPSSVIKLVVVDRNRIRVSFHPKSIGARDLISNPFFQNAKLAPPSPPHLIASGRAHLWRCLYMTLFSCVCTMPVLVLAWARLPDNELLYGTISLVLASIIQGVVGGPFYVSAAKTFFFSRMVDMDILVVLSTTAAYVYSVAAYAYLCAEKPLMTGQFFETSTLLITLIMVGRTVSAFARQRAVESITTESLQVNTAIIVNQDSSGEQEIDARLLQYNDVFKLLPEMSIVTDGIVLAGESEIDESLVTGESNLVYKQPGSAVIAGTINHTGTLKVRITRLPYENTIKTIGTMVDEAKATKPKVQDLADRVAGYFVPAILVVAWVIFIVWFVVGKMFRGQDKQTSAITAMTYAVSVLIVSCPCAIGLAVPMVVVVAGGVGARHGLIVKTAEAIDIARKVSHVIFDKTGTLTQGKLRVIEQDLISESASFAPSLILGLTTNSTHPVSTAIVAHLRDAGIKSISVEHIVSHPGRGLEAEWKGSLVRAGNPYWLNVQDQPSVARLSSSGLSLFCVTLDEKLIAVYGLRDELRPDAHTTIAALRSRGAEISILSGDNDSSVHAVASQLEISQSNVRTRCTPAQKQDYVKSALASTSHLRRSWFGRRKQEIVLFCGDGTNDAPSLAQASIGVHMKSGTDIAGSAADAIIMRPHLHGIITLMDLSVAFHRRVVFNFFWCFVYNLFAVLLAAGAFVGIWGVRIKPEWAGLGELVSVLPVIAVAMGLRLRKF